MKLSLCMIVKDEERNLRDCILSVKSVVDEVVVVDTGSTDYTKDIARELGARVFDFPWCDDFSAARNESISHATGDYILWLDADDRIEASELNKIRQLKTILPAEKNRAYYFVVSSQAPLEGESRFLQLRLFPRVKGAFFEGKIHEQIFQTLMKRGIELCQTDILVRHTGYLDREVIQQKVERNLKIIERELQSDPENVLLHFNSARTLSGLGKWTEAISHMEKIIEKARVEKKEKPLWRQVSIMLGQYYIQRNSYENALSLFKELAKEFQEDSLVSYYHGKSLFLIGDYQGAIEPLEHSLKISLKVDILPLDLDGIRYDQHYTLGQCYMKMGETAKAKEMFIQSLHQQADHSKSLEALGYLSLKEHRFKEAIDYYERAVQRGAESDQNYSNLGLAYRKLGLWGEAEKSLMRSLEMNPQRIEALTNLGHLYCEMGEESKALPFLTKALNIDPDLLDVRLSLSEIYFLRYDLDFLVEQCDALLRALDLPRNICLESFKDLSVLYEMMAEAFSARGRKALSLMAYHLSFLIFPSRAMVDRILSSAKDSGVFESSVHKVEKVLAFHKQKGWPTPYFEEIFGQA